MIEAALATRDLLLSEGLDSWPKVTSGKSFHIVVPADDKISNGSRKNPKRYLLSSVPKSTRRLVRSAHFHGLHAGFSFGARFVDAVYYNCNFGDRRRFLISNRGSFRLRILNHT